MCDWRAAGTYSRDIGNWGYFSLLLEKHVFLHQFTASPQQTYQMETVQDNGKQSTTFTSSRSLSPIFSLYILNLDAFVASFFSDSTKLWSTTQYLKITRKVSFYNIASEESFFISLIQLFVYFYLSNISCLFIF